MEGTKKREINHCLNVIKGIACIGVVFTHVLFPGKIGNIILTAAACLVPVFFMISGYYAFSESNLELIKKTPEKIVYIERIAGMSGILYIMWKFMKAFIKNVDFTIVVQDFNLKNVFRFFLINSTSFLDGGHLWFLFALLYCYVTLWLVVQYGKVKILYPMVFVMLVGRVLVTYTGNWQHTQNFWFDGFPYFFLGYFMREYRTDVKKVSNKILVVVIAGALIFSELIYWYSFFRINMYEIGTIVAAVSVFLYALQNGEKGKGCWLEQLGKKYSLFVYVVHVIVMESISIVDSRIFGTLPLWYSWIKPFVVVGITIGLAVLFQRIKE